MGKGNVDMSQPVTLEVMGGALKGFRESLMTDVKTTIENTVTNAFDELKALLNGAKAAVPAQAEPEPIAAAPDAAAQAAAVLAAAGTAAVPPAPPAAPAAAKPVSPAKAATPAKVGINDIFAASDRAQKAWNESFQKAKTELTEALSEAKFVVFRDAEYVDMETNYARPAMVWLTLQIAKGRMTAQEAVEYARKQLEPKPWGKDVDVTPRIHREMMAAFNAARLYLRPVIRINGGDAINSYSVLGQAIENGELTVDQAVEQARAHGWTEEAHESFGAMVQEKIEAERADDARDEERGRKAGKGKGRK